MATLEQKQAFFDKCQYHDWYYDYSDDHRVWARGCDNASKLKETAASDPELKEIYKAWAGYMFSGTSFGTEKQPKPTRPE